jgi:NitT/TauT family transport system substrate-binding protein
MNSMQQARTKRTWLPLVACIALTLAACGGGAGDTEALQAAQQIRIPLGAGGVGFLPLLVAREHDLIEKHAREAGLQDLTVDWIDLGGPAVMNDALLSGSVDFIAAGPPAFLTLWDKTRGANDVRGVAALSSLPMYLNTREERLTRVDGLSALDKVAVTAIKVSIPALIMQMYALEHYGEGEAERFDQYTVTMTHPDAVVALLSGSGTITAHFTSPPFHQRELRDPAVRTIMTSQDVMPGNTTFAMLSTTRRFHDANPQAYAAVLAALDEANAMIRNDPGAAAQLLIDTGESAGLTRDELVEVLRDPAIEFTTVPANFMRYATFMHGIGTLGQLPASWQDLFFPEVHHLPGN